MSLDSSEDTPNETTCPRTADPLATPDAGGEWRHHGVAVRSDGWSADVYISGLNTNGTYSYGLGSNNALTGAERLRIALTSQGFDDSGASTTVPRTVVGTKRVRKAYRTT